MLRNKSIRWLLILSTVLVGSLCVAGYSSAKSDNLPKARDLEPGEWTWIYPGGDTECALGGEYRFLVRPGDTDKLLIHFEGGGACWDGATCDPANSETQAGANHIYRDTT